MADRTRILFFFEKSVDGDSLLASLVDEGFEVTGAKTFLEAVWFLAGGGVKLFLIYLPETEWVRNAIVTEIHRSQPSLPIIALAPTISNELCQVLDRLHVATVLPAVCDRQSLVAAIHKGLGSSDAVTGGRT